MRVTRVSIKGLFSIFNHEIDFKIEDRITIIHGPNGYGKTVILKMIAGLLSGSYGIFFSVPFHEFELRFDDSTALLVKRTQKVQPVSQVKSRAPVPARAIDLSSWFIDAAGERHHFRLSKRITDAMRSAINVATPSNIRAVENMWFDSMTDRVLTDDQLLEQYGSHIRSRNPSLYAEIDLTSDSPLARIQRSLHVHLISTERLDTGESDTSAKAYKNALASIWETVGNRQREAGTTTAVEKYAKELAVNIADVLATYAGRASELDRTFPARLLAEMQRGPISNVGLRERLQEVDAQRSVLTGLGILDEGNSFPVPEELFNEALAVLSVYVRDTEQKLATFKDLSEKIGLLTKIINERFSHKKLKINRENGFVFESRMGRISPSDLSSGEQHELVLVYEMLFKVDKTWLVLLDEPEISLHVGWQENFLADLMQIVKLSNVDVLIATHSPVVIGPHWDLTVQLNDPVDDGDLQ